MNACSVAKLCLTLCDPRDYSLSGSSVHRIPQARILKWLPFPSPGDLPTSPALAGEFFTTESPGKSSSEEDHIKR